MEVLGNTQQYKDGVLNFIDYAITNYKVARTIEPNKRLKKLKILCPCTYCVNHTCQCVETVEFHLFRYGIDQNYTNCTKH